MTALYAVLSVALAAQEAGISVLPARRDGSKVPISLPVPIDCEHAACVKARERARREHRPARGWKHYTHARLSRDEVRRLFRNAEASRRHRVRQHEAGPQTQGTPRDGRSG